MEELRYILHIDMDAFYASIEQRDNPELRNKPLAVGGRSGRGVVAAASYEARKYGVHSALPSAIALKRCPNLIFVKARFEVYKKVSTTIRNIFLAHTPLVEPLSLDEAYLDITDQVKSLQEAASLAQNIRNEIKQATTLNASAGISYNKFLAKMASGQNKPNGQFTIAPEHARAFMDDLPVHKFHGIGEATAAKMNKLGIFYGKDLLKRKDYELIRHFGKAGLHYFNIIRGNDHRKVNPNRIRKSIGVERTFADNRMNDNELMLTLKDIITLLIARVDKHQKSGKTLTLKLRYSDFTTITRSKTLDTIYDQKSIDFYARELLMENREENRPVRLMGLTLSNLEESGGNKQLKLKI
ncbi:MAG: DNA polymerase IV [Bacteroidales bacterium]|nr:DNA polymerase IV [Bacteroidales bacterium]